MKKKDIVDCFCGDDEDDGLMVNCEKCNKWQHAECVNITKFSNLRNYTCPKCLKWHINCICDVEGDFQHAVVKCPKCGNYQHKRHVGLGIGTIPPDYICSECEKKIRPRPIHQKITPIESLFREEFTQPKRPKPINQFAVQIPPGQFYSYLNEQNQLISPLELTKKIYQKYRHVIFSAHPLLKHFVFDVRTMDTNFQISNSYAFCCYFVRAVAFMMKIHTGDVVELLNHLINMDIYLRPFPISIRNVPASFAPQVARNTLNLEYSDRAGYIFEEIGIEEYNSTKVPNIALVSKDPIGKTIITLEPIKNGQLICEVYGNIIHMEELDKDSRIPKFTYLGITNSPLFVDASKFEESAYFSKMNRSFIANTEIRLFTRGHDDIHVGIFATPYYTLAKMTERTNKEDEYVINEGDEIFLPFDIIPTQLKNHLEWTTVTKFNQVNQVEIFIPRSKYYNKEKEMNGEYYGCIDSFDSDSDLDPVPKRKNNTTNKARQKIQICTRSAEKKQKKRNEIINSGVDVNHKNETQFANLFGVNPSFTFKIVSKQNVPRTENVVELPQSLSKLPISRGMKISKVPAFPGKQPNSGKWFTKLSEIDDYNKSYNDKIPVVDKTPTFWELDKSDFIDV